MSDSVKGARAMRNLDHRLRGAAAVGRSRALTWIATGCFVLAVAFAAAPALEAGPATAGGLLLLCGLAGVAFIGFFAFGGQDTTDITEAAEGLIASLDEPSAMATPEGRILAANDPWAALMGPGRRLPKSGPAAGGLFAALGAARRVGAARTLLRAGGADRRVVIARLDGRRFLVRLMPAEQMQAAVPAQSEFAMPAPPVPAQIAVEAPKALDDLAAAAPFGAALLEGDRPFDALIVQANSALIAMAGEAAAEGKPFGGVIEEASRQEAEGRLTGDRLGPVEVKLAGDPSHIAHLYLTRHAGRYVAYLLDVSEQKKIELQLAQAHKMQAIGQLAGGVAHDFNNLLMAIELRLDELLQRHPLGDPSYEGLSQIRQTGARAADLVRKLLAYSRKQTVQRVTLDVGELVSEFEVLLGRLLPEDVKLQTHYGKDLPQVRADKSQLETAIMNLVVNARDAVRGREGGGVIRVTSARLSKAQAISLGFADPRAGPGDVAMIEVTDNGAGIPPEAIGAIFDPFFTTKAVGEGTGLGLSTVYGIVKQADGWIHVESPAGQGATFRIFLPSYIAPPSAAPAPVVPPKVPAAPRDLSGAGRILFVEDEDAVRSVAARLLRARGYEVIEACDGEEALIIAEENAGKIDLMISDVIMPGMDGPTLLKKARGYLGNAPVMFISGYAEADFSNTLEGETGVTFLPKPIDIKTLAERVKQQLQAA